MSSKYPGPEEEDYKPVVMHEYFHVYQQANLSIPELPDTDGAVSYTHLTLPTKRIG